MVKKNAPIPEETSTEPKASVNKTQAIKDALKAHPRKGPAELSALFAAQGMQISAAYISTIKTTLKKKRGPGKAKVAAGAGSSNEQWLATLLAAKKLAAQLGGVEAAKQAIDALSKLAN
jgi:hypothetical protein